MSQRRAFDVLPPTLNQRTPFLYGCIYLYEHFKIRHFSPTLLRETELCHLSLPDSKNLKIIELKKI